MPAAPTPSPPSPAPTPSAADSSAPATESHGISLYKEYFNFGSAHFLIFADGTREELHGHNYRATLELDAGLDAAWMVADFLVVKPLFRRVCDALDHRTLLPLHNPYLRVEPGEREVVAYFGADRYVIPARDVLLLPIENSSSELLARHLLRGLVELLADRLPALRLRRARVTVQESPGQSAWYELRWDAA